MRAGHFRYAAVALAVALTASGAPAAHGAAGLESIGHYSAPVYVTTPPQDPGRVFVVELGGRVRVTQWGLTSTFLDISSMVQVGGEGGLLSMAFAPDYGESGRFYVLYAGDGGDIHVDEFTAGGDRADPTTRRSVLVIDHGSGHYGGQLQFGPDGYLYISTGDDAGGPPGTFGDPLGNAQNPEVLLGKILRIDPRLNGPESFGIPADNPFVGVPGRDEIWSLGLRNPWRFSFDRATGDLAIGDVGHDAWEEIDYAPRSAGGGRGENYGWNCREGPDAYSGCSGDFTEPSFAYPHIPEVSCQGSITGGYVVRDPALPELWGRYLYADFCRGELRSVSLDLPAASGDRNENLPVPVPTSFGEGACGEIYVTSLYGAVYRIKGEEQGSCSGATITGRASSCVEFRAKASPVARKDAARKKMKRKAARKQRRSRCP